MAGLMRRMRLAFSRNDIVYHYRSTVQWMIFQAKHRSPCFHFRWQLIFLRNNYGIILISLFLRYDLCYDHNEIFDEICPKIRKFVLTELQFPSAMTAHFRNCWRAASHDSLTVPHLPFTGFNFTHFPFYIGNCLGDMSNRMNSQQITRWYCVCNAMIDTSRRLSWIPIQIKNQAPTPHRKSILNQSIRRQRWQQRKRLRHTAIEIEIRINDRSN